MFGNNQMTEQWKPKALILGKEGYTHGSYRQIYRQLKNEFGNENFTYDMLRTFLRKNGFLSGEHRRPVKRRSKVKNFNVMVSGRYAICKIDSQGNVICKPMPISQEEALKIIERKVFS